MAAYKEFRQGKSEEEIFKEMEESSLEENAALSAALMEQQSSRDAHGVEAGAKAVYLENEKAGGISGSLFALKMWLIRAVIIKGFSLLVTSIVIMISVVFGLTLLLLCLRFVAPEAYCSVIDWPSDGDTYDRCIGTIFDWDDLEAKTDTTESAT